MRLDFVNSFLNTFPKKRKTKETLPFCSVIDRAGGGGGRGLVGFFFIVYGAVHRHACCSSFAPAGNNDKRRLLKHSSPNWNVCVCVCVFFKAYLLFLCV